MARRNLAHLVVLSLIFTGSFAKADSSFGVTAGVGHSDNIRRNETDKESDTIFMGGLDFSVIQKTRRLAVDAVADLAYLNYQNTYDSEVAGNLSGTLNLSLVPERFEWLFQDSFGQVRSDPFAPVTPENRENINYFTTGPDLSLRMGSALEAKLSGRYSRATYEITPVDSNRYSGLFALQHEFSPVNIISLNVGTEHIDYDASSTGTDYNRDQVYLLYALQGGRTSLELDAGANRISQAGNSDDGFLFRLNIERTISAFSTATLNMGQEFSDGASTFRLEQDIDDSGFDARSTPSSSNAFRSRYASLAWDFYRQRTGFGAGVVWFDETYRQQSALDQRRLDGNLSFLRDLTSNLRFELTARYAKSDFKNAVGDYYETSISPGFSWMFGNRLALIAQYDHFDRSSDISTGEYTENRIWLRLRYGVERKESAGPADPASSD